RVAPSASMRRAASTASTVEAYDPPSEKLSGVTLTTPITEGLGQRSRKVAPEMSDFQSDTGRQDAAGSGGGCIAAPGSGLGDGRRSGFFSASGSSDAGGVVGGSSANT